MKWCVPCVYMTHMMKLASTTVAPTDKLMTLIIGIKHHFLRVDRSFGASVKVITLNLLAPAIWTRLLASRRMVAGGKGKRICVLRRKSPLQFKLHPWWTFKRWCLGRSKAKNRWRRPLVQAQLGSRSLAYWLGSSWYLGSNPQVPPYYTQFHPHISRWMNQLMSLWY